MHRFLQTHRWTVAALLLALSLGFGWAQRERAFAQEKAQLLASHTVTQAALKTEPFLYDGTARGTVGLYFNGRTAGTRSLVVGQFVLKKFVGQPDRGRFYCASKLADLRWAKALRRRSEA